MGTTIAFANQDAFGSVSSCGDQVIRAIERVCADTGCTQLHLVTHSEGSLVSLWSTEAGSWIVLQVTEAGFDHADACDLRKRDFALQGSDGRTYSSVVSFLVKHLASVEAKQGSSQRRQHNGEFPKNGGQRPLW